MSAGTDIDDVVIPGVPRPRKAGKSARPWLQPALVTGASVPVVYFLVQAIRGKLGANPIAEVLNAFGLVALVLLTMSLACTPVKMVTGVGWIQPLRRTFGLLGFGYAALHFLIYTVIDQQLAIKAIVADVVKRPFITVGMLAFLLLIPLAWTSTQAQVKKLGGARWRALHKLVYVVVPLGVVHFILRVKKDLSEPLVYGGIVGVLLAIRLGMWMRKKAAGPRRAD